MDHLVAILSLIPSELSRQRTIGIHMCKINKCVYYLVYQYRVEYTTHVAATVLVATRTSNRRVRTAVYTIYVYSYMNILVTRSVGSFILHICMPIVLCRESFEGMRESIVQYVCRVCIHLLVVKYEM